MQAYLVVEGYQPVQEIRTAEVSAAVPHVAAVPGNRVAFITQAGKPNVNGVAKVEYKPSRQAGPNTHRYIRNFEGFVLNGQAVARAAIQLKKAGFVPDVVCAHPSWGESLFIKDVFPDARLLLFCEFYYRAVGADVGFDPAYPVDIDDLCRVRVKNAAHMLSLESMDWGVSPTEWQRRQYPEWWRKQISLIHDGIRMRPIHCRTVLSSAPAMRS
jgi:hypothetical protein